ncbi:hypothetical protein NE237_002829 [Protea cynaroides]|uniref:Uncharacterized protein n=1 Tax=Protea cynaroides TaxID=273540 RepID=A0A9Q0QRW1_9MAGN|nr:hypothetical protein NE237_002829 [Protea cynaroides]
MQPKRKTTIVGTSKSKKIKTAMVHEMLSKGEGNKSRAQEVRAKSLVPSSPSGKGYVLKIPATPDIEEAPSSFVSASTISEVGKVSTSFSTSKSPSKSPMEDTQPLLDTGVHSTARVILEWEPRPIPTVVPTADPSIFPESNKGKGVVKEQVPSRSMSPSPTGALYWPKWSIKNMASGMNSPDIAYQLLSTIGGCTSANRYEVLLLPSSDHGSKVLQAREINLERHLLDPERMRDKVVIVYRSYSKKNEALAKELQGMKKRAAKDQYEIAQLKSALDVERQERACLIANLDAEKRRFDDAIFTNFIWSPI